MSSISVARKSENVGIKRNKEGPLVILAKRFQFIEVDSGKNMTNRFSIIRLLSARNFPLCFRRKPLSFCFVIMFAQ